MTDFSYMNSVWMVGAQPVEREERDFLSILDVNKDGVYDKKDKEIIDELLRVPSKDLGKLLHEQAFRNGLEKSVGNK